MSRLERLVEDRSATIVTAELPVVDGGGLKDVQHHLNRLAPWADAINATDNAAAHAHASNVAIAIAIQQAGVEPILQVVCRDKNRLAIQADIVGAAMHGVENVALLTGDDVTAGDEPETRRVFDLDGPQAIKVARTLARGTYLSGRRLDPAPHLFLGAVENPAAPPAEYRVDRMAKKIAAGARFFQLQICYIPARLEQFVQRARDRGLTTQAAVLPTICLLRGARALRFIDEHVPGISVPSETIDKVARSTDQAEAAYQLALSQAGHALSLPGVRGIHITDFRHDEAAARLVEELGLRQSLSKEHDAHNSAFAV
jgi:methylenetetrahydrofolate reductase (NADPH)